MLSIQGAVADRVIAGAGAQDVRGYLTVQLNRLNNKRLKVGDIKADELSQRGPAHESHLIPELIDVRRARKRILAGLGSKS